MYSGVSSTLMHLKIYSYLCWYMQYELIHISAPAKGESYTLTDSGLCVSYIPVKVLTGMMGLINLN